MDGIATYSPRKLANIQLQYFKNKVKSLIDNLPPPTGDPSRYLVKAIRKWRNSNQRIKFTLREISITETSDILRRMGNSKSFGHDQLDGWSLKIISDHITIPLHHIINMSIRHRKFATKWKIAKVIPLHKGGKLDKSSPSSYRPISLLPVTSKLVEKVVQKQLLQFMEMSGQLSLNSHAYRNHHSTTTAMLQISDLIFTATDKNLITTLTTVDESSAFDCVKHEFLLRKLQLYNCDESVCDWMLSYLSFRTQYVMVGAHQSAMSPVYVGVPQGSILGPLLYSIYTNDISEIVKEDDCDDPSHSEDDNLFTPNCQICGMIPFYADDAMIIHSSKSRDDNQNKN